MNIFKIQNKLFMLQDKIKMMEMAVAHAKKEALEIDELLLDLVDEELEKRFNQIA